MSSRNSTKAPSKGSGGGGANAPTNNSSTSAPASSAAPAARPQLSKAMPSEASSSSSTGGGGGGRNNASASAGQSQAPAAPVVVVPDLNDLRALLSETPEAFQVSGFIERLIKPLLDPEATRPGRPIRGTDFGFDPAALHDLFTATLDRLGKLGREVDERIHSIQEDGRKMAPQRKKEIDRHHRSLQEVHETIEDIETHFRKVGLTAVRIGQSLSQTEFQRQKAEHAQRLLEYFSAFDTLRYEAVLKDAESERIEMLSNDVLAPLTEEVNYNVAASILSDLNVVCEDLNAPHLENAVNCIRVFAERLEKRLLDKFEAAAMAEGQHNSSNYNTAASGDSSDVAVMRDCAVSLLKFGDAVKLYNTYIYTIVAKQVQASRRDDMNDADEMRDALSEFFGLISSLCRKAFTLIRQVFPPSASLKVTRMLIDRMVNDPAFGIQVRVAEVLDDKESKDSLSVSDSLDMLLMVHDKTNALATDLIDHCLEAERNYLEDLKGNSNSSSHHRRGGNDDRGYDEEDDDDAIPMEENAGTGPAGASGKAAGAAGGTSAGSSGSNSRSQEALSSYVKIQFAELFVGQRASYLEKEVSLLRLRLVNGLAAVVGEGIGMTGQERPSKSKKLLEKVKKSHTGAAGQGGQDLVADLPAIRHEKIENYDVMLQNWLRKEVLATFLDYCREAIGRNAKMFRKDEERADNVLEMLSVVHKFLATSVLLPSLSAASNIVQQPTSGAPPASFYKILQAVHWWVDRYKEFFRTTALPEVASKTTTQTVLLESCRKFLVRVERAGAKTVERGLDALMRSVERIHRELVTKTDYLPKDNTIAELQATRACLTIRDCLTLHIDHFSKNLPPKDVRVIVSALALRVQDLLMNRIKQLRINTSGALVLMQDVEIIYGCFALPSLNGKADGKGNGNDTVSSNSGDSLPAAAHQAPEVKTAYDELKEVVGLFIVPPENLKGLMDHGYLANQDRNDLFIYISNRADFRVHGFLAPWVRSIFTDVKEDVEEEAMSRPRHSTSVSPAPSPPSRGNK